jgi:hypothetical protein
VGTDADGYLVGEPIVGGDPMSEGSERDVPSDEEAEAQVDAAKEAEAEDEREHFEGAETKADLDEEAGQANRPGTERPPV